jgi:hypothetical protein
LRSSTLAAQTSARRLSAGRLSTSLRISAGEKPVSSSFCDSMRLARLALQLLHEGQRAEALLDEAAHRTQLAHHLDLVGAVRSRPWHARQRRGDRPPVAAARPPASAWRWARAQRLRAAPALARGGQWRGLAPWRRRGGHGRLRWAPVARAAAVRTGSPPSASAAICASPPLEHALAHVVLERQRAHLQLLHVLLSMVAFTAGFGARVVAGVGRRPWSRASAGRACAGARASRSPPRPRRRVPRQPFAPMRSSCSTLSGAMASTSTPSAQGRGGHHHRIVAKGLPHQGQGVARGAGGEAFEVHALLR